MVTPNARPLLRPSKACGSNPVKGSLQTSAGEGANQANSKHNFKVTVASEQRSAEGAADTMRREPTRTAGPLTKHKEPAPGSTVQSGSQGSAKAERHTLGQTIGSRHRHQVHDVKGHRPTKTTPSSVDSFAKDNQSQQPT